MARISSPDFREQRTPHFDVRELALTFPGHFSAEVFALDAFRVVVTDTQIEFPNQAAGADRGKGFGGQPVDFPPGAGVFVVLLMAGRSSNPEGRATGRDATICAP